MNLLFFAVSFLASIIGSICGIGGGVLIKPVLDAAGVMTISSINFLSGCTVLTMSVISMLQSLKRRDSEIELNTSTPLAIGAAIGGLLGKEAFQFILSGFPDKNKVVAFQAIILMAVTMGTLIYAIYASRIKTLSVTNPLACGAIGLILGLLSSFLGIGGGPINLMVLTFFFSMETKQAAKNSIYIIMFSQFASLIITIVRGYIPEFPLIVLLFMIFGGFSGGILGSIINKRISSKDVTKLFIFVMVLIILININNALINLI